MTRIRFVLAFAALVIAASMISGCAKSSTERAGREVEALRQAIFEAEDSRAPDTASLASLTAALVNPQADIRRRAIRAVGRLERPSLVDSVAPLLADDDATVRAEAANALGQCLHALRASGPGEPGEAAPVARVRDLLIARIAVESDPGVLGTLARTIGRLPYLNPDSIQAAEAALLAVAGEPSEPLDPASLPVLYGLAKGTESLFRLNARVASPGAGLSERMKTIATGSPDPGWDSRTREAAARSRRLALMALTSAGRLDEGLIETAFRDPDDQVRRLALAGIGGRNPTTVPAPVVERLVRSGLQDPAGIVRYEALRIYGRLFLAADPDPVFAAIDDPWPHTALLAVDLLGQTTSQKERARDLLENLARDFLPSGSPAKSWHAAAHALVSLARIAPDTARSLLPVFETADAWPVRMYAARAAGLLGDEAALRRRTDDPHDNVREAALSALTGLKGHEIDDLLLAALARPDSQLIRTAARGLRQSPNADRAVPALFASLSRLTGGRRDTSRDPRLALLDRIGELGTPAAAPGLDPYLEDFDPEVAETAASIIERWTGRRPEIRPRPFPVVPARLEDIEKWRSAAVRVTMAGNGVFEMTLLVDEAPATVARFVALARAGYYDGLTFHRVAPNFLIQGGSPGANEFMGDGPYLRDEVGLESHTRGAIGISTRGRDTGDAQICPDVVDNARLDHDYTVFARVTSGMDVVDRVLEGDVIERIEIVAAPSANPSPGGARSS